MNLRARAPDPLDLYKKNGVKFELKPGGAWIVDGIEVAHTFTCCHGGEVFISVPGSSQVRGFCRNCMGVTCGKRECDKCVPFERKCELVEQGKAPHL